MLSSVRLRRVSRPLVHTCPDSMLMRLARAQYDDGWRQPERAPIGEGCARRWQHPCCCSLVLASDPPSPSPFLPAHARSPSSCAAPLSDPRSTRARYVFGTSTSPYRRAPLTRSPLSVPQGTPPARMHNAVGRRYGCSSMVENSARVLKGAGIGEGCWRPGGGKR
jgi:hypothetical protein